MNYPGDTVLQDVRGEWIQQYADTLERLEGASYYYYNNVTANPPNYDLKEGDKCLVCRLK
jgi:molybdopterin converting factor small subunit